MIQNWSGRVLAMVVFFVLARILSPTEFGIASSAILVFSVVAMISELGFGDALVQKQVFHDADADRPFFVAIGVSVALALATAALSGWLADLFAVQGLAPYLVATSAVAPFAIAVSFQEAMYRRAMLFRQLAVRTLIAGLAGGVVGIGMALGGLGAWALIGQFSIQILVSMAWLWMRPLWRPAFPPRAGASGGIGAFGLNLVALRLVDFATLRSVDLMILAKFGPATFGLFSVASRLYQFMMQLLQASVANVALAMLSRVASDLERMRRLFVRTSSLSAMACAPVFFLMASLTPEIVPWLFGAHWMGAEPIMRPLLIVGGLHSVLFGAGSYLTALGRPDLLLRLIILKAAFILVPLVLVHPADIQSLTLIFAAGLMAEVPFTIGTTLRILTLRWRDLARPVGVPLCACALGFGASLWLRGGLALTAGSLSTLFLCALAFTTTYLGLLALLALRPLLENARFMATALRRKGR